MWLLGVLLWMSLIAGIVAFANRKPRAIPSSARWDIASLAGAASGIVSPLASFSVAAAVFLANLTRAAQSPAFADVMAMFLIAFIILMGTAIMYATDRSIREDPQFSEDFEVTSRVLFILSTAAFYLGIMTSWTGLHPLLLSIDLIELAAVFAWLLLVAILAGGVRMAAWLYSLLEIRSVTAATIPVVAFTGVAFYKLALAPRFPALWPQANPVLSFAVLVFAIAAAAIGVESVVIAFNGDMRLHVLFRRLGRTILPSYVALAITAVIFLWFSVVTP